jgi:hypothetical protein
MTTTTPSPKPAPQAALPWLELLRVLLAVDALIPFALGLVLFFVPARALELFHFGTLPGGVTYMVSLLGAVFLSLAFGYGVAATNPLRHVVWVQMGIVRGGLELALGLVCVSRGLVTWEQTRFSLAVAGLLVIAYVVFYPRKSWFQASAPALN